jgi:hypothetical protein
MVTGQGAQTSSPWEQFALRNNFGVWGNSILIEKNKKACQRCLKETAKSPRPKSKEITDNIKELFQNHFTEEGRIQINPELSRYLKVL